MLYSASTAAAANAATPPAAVYIAAMASLTDDTSVVELDDFVELEVEMVVCLAVAVVLTVFEVEMVPDGWMMLLLCIEKPVDAVRVGLTVLEIEMNEEDGVRTVALVEADMLMPELELVPDWLPEYEGLLMPNCVDH